MSGDFTIDRKKNPGGIIGKASMGGLYGCCHR